MQDDYREDSLRDEFEDVDREMTMREERYRTEQRRETRHSFFNGVLVGVLSVLLLEMLVVGVTAGVSLLHLGRTGTSTTSGVSTAEEEVKQDDEKTSDILAKNEKSFNKELENKLSEINQIIDSQFIFPVDSQEMMDSTLEGYMKGLNDVYSVYYTPKEYADTIEDSDGTFVGIGVSVQQAADTKIITALTVYEGSPADEGGMKDGDIITGVDGEDISKMDMSDVVSRIRGEEGTTVVVTVYRDGKYLDLTMVRRSIEKKTVEYKMMDNKVGYIQLVEFDSVSVSQMKTAIEDLQSQGMESLVLDLRNNPGGLLNSVLAIADYFLPEEQIFYYEDKQGQKTEYNATAEQICKVPMSILVNGNSASAAEVLSGSLKDNDRAVIVGEQTFGKGIVQSFYTLSDGSAIKLTTAHYFTPDGTDIHGVGIEPNIVCTDDPETEDIDEQLETAIESIPKQ